MVRDGLNRAVVVLILCRFDVAENDEYNGSDESNEEGDGVSTPVGRGALLTERG